VSDTVLSENSFATILLSPLALLGLVELAKLAGRHVGAHHPALAPAPNRPKRRRPA